MAIASIPAEQASRRARSASASTCVGGVGARVWSMLAESQGLQTEVVVDRLAIQFAVPRQRLADDVVTFLRALENKGLVQAAEAKGYAAA